MSNANKTADKAPQAAAQAAPFAVPPGYILMIAPKGATGGNVEGHVFEVVQDGSGTGYAAIPEPLYAIMLSHGYALAPRE